MSKFNRRANGPTFYAQTERYRLKGLPHKAPVPGYTGYFQGMNVRCFPKPPSVRRFSPVSGMIPHHLQPRLLGSMWAVAMWEGGEEGKGARTMFS